MFRANNNLTSVFN